MEEQEERKEFWENNWQNFLTPRGHRWPEGFKVLDLLSDVFRSFSSVVEYGCGDGRLSPAFRSDRYLGIDFNENAVYAAKINNPEHRYEVRNTIKGNPGAVLFYTVLLHNPDEEIRRIIEESEIDKSVIVVAEVIKDKREQGGNLPVYGHSIADYASLFREWNLKETINVPYLYYKDTDISFLFFEPTLASLSEPEDESSIN